MALFLFDIDGTLLNTGGSGRKAANIVFKKYFNVDDVFNKIYLIGRSDKAIWEEAIKLTDISYSYFQKIKPVILREYYKELKRVILNNNKKEILPGIYNLLSHLKGKKHLLGLITGNLKKAAYIKLSPFNLEKFFPVGGFGDDSGDRNIIAKKAIKRARKFYNINFKNEEIFIIGDTPADIISARSNKVRSIAVATGLHSFKDLKKYNPDFLFKNFANIDTFIKKINLK